MYFGSIHCFCPCGELHMAILDTFESIKDAMHSENIEELNSLATTKSCIFKVYGPKKLHAVQIPRINKAVFYQRHSPQNI